MGMPTELLRRPLPAEFTSELPVAKSEAFGTFQSRLAQARPWLVWISIPVLGVLIVALTVGSLNNWQFDRQGYWLVQRDWFFALNSAFTFWPERVWSDIADLGSGEVLLLLLSPLLIRFPRSWLAMLFAAPVAAILSATGKYLSAVPRPAAVLDTQQFTVIGDVLAAHNSFPSGHSITIGAAAIAFLASMRLRPSCRREWLLILLVMCIVVLVCLSRVAVGAHWPLDLAAGAAFGWVAGLCGARLARCFSRSWRFSQAPRGRRVLGVALLCGSLMLLAVAQRAPYAAEVLWLSVACGMVTAFWLVAGKSDAVSLGEMRLRLKRSP
jgi:membrane-associated phospholipid phosphatase